MNGVFTKDVHDGILVIVYFFLSSFMLYFLNESSAKTYVSANAKHEYLC